MTITLTVRLPVACAVALLACAPADPPPVAGDQPGVMTVTARGLSFVAPRRIPSGWTTIRFVNESDVVHFALIERLPEGITVRDQQEQVAPVFQQGMDLLAAGRTDAAMAKFGELPAWYSEVVFLGGPGLTSAGRTSEATVYLNPGTYLLECYVKTGGVFHSYNPDPATFGMVHQFTVTETPSAIPEPDTNLRMHLSWEDGITLAGTPVAGRQRIAVQFDDQKIYGNFVGHDVHLVRLDDEADLQALADWMDWTRPSGLQTPAPAEFLGGLQEMPAGSTGYFSADLDPGRYAFIAEVPASDTRGMLKVFTVAPRPES